MSRCPFSSIESRPISSINERLKFVGVGPSEVNILGSLAPIITRIAPQVVDQFYEHLFKFSKLSKFLDDEEVVKALKQTQAQYIISLCRADYGSEYTAERMAIGLAHARIHLDPCWYLGMCSRGG